MSRLAPFCFAEVVAPVVPEAPKQNVSVAPLTLCAPKQNVPMAP